MSLTPTLNFSWQKPDVGTQSGAWGGNLNTIFDQIDALCLTLQTTANAALPRAGGTMTGRIIGLTESMHFVDKGTVSGGLSIDASAAQHQKMTVNPAVSSVTFTALPASGEAYAIALEIVNGGVGFTWGASFKWPGTVPPVLTNPGTDIVTIITHDAGTTWRLLGIQKDLR